METHYPHFGFEIRLNKKRLKLSSKSKSFAVVPPGIVIFLQVAEYHCFLKATQL